MPPGSDPFRTLGLHPGASVDEIRRAYRRLAKANHPDSAGEAALPRFLAIQAAYEALVAPTTRGPGARPRNARPAQPGNPWQGDPERARATRENAARRPGARPRSAGSHGATGAAGAASAGPSGRGDGARPGAAGESSGQAGTSGAQRAGRATGGGRGSGRRRAPNKAVPGSTSYDAAEDEPFEPEWSGGTWYGASSGTYWTINPREYADPRKHGPEYQRRAQRRAEATDREAGPEPVADAAPEPGPDVSGTADTATEPSSPGATEPGPLGDKPPAGAGLPFVGRWSASGGLGGFGGRVALALVGWPPIGVALSSLAGEVTGCSRFSATCVDVFGVGTWLAQLAIIALLLAVPALAAISATGTLAALAAAVPAAVVLSASGGSRQPEASAAVLGAVLTVAYLVGVTIGTARRLGVPRVPWRS